MSDRPTPGGERRVALVTGAGSGIGAAVSARLRADGLDVVGVDLKVPDRAVEVPAAPGAWHAVACDLTTPEGNAAAVAAALERFGRIDAIVANAGVQHVAPIAEFPLERWNALLALMLTSPFLLAQHAWPALTERGDGRFVAVASAHALVASPFKAAYVSAKHGLLGLVKTLALEGAPHGLSACALCPGYVRTPLVEHQIAAQAAAHDLPEEQVLEDVILAPHAVKRLIEPDEIAAAVAFLLGPAGRAFTGAAVPMDQGWTAR